MTTRQLYYLVTISDLGSLSSAAQVRQNALDLD